MKTISVINTKGGVGKTVTTINLGAALAARGLRVLLFDVDMQAGLSNHFNLDAENRSSADVLSGAVGIEECLAELRPGLLAVAANASIERAERDLSSASGGEVRMRRAVKRFFRHMETMPASARFDVMLIDCPSGWGPISRNALLASDSMLVPLNSEPAAITCAVSTIAEARELGEYHDHDIELLGVLITRFRQTNQARAVEEQSVKLWGDAVFETRIRQAERVNELGFGGETLSDRAGGKVGDDHDALACEVIKRAKLGFVAQGNKK